ncbi:MAG: thioredoxin family protein [Ignavibacterium sp.]|nr:MAG: thioredoxin family protein [Ignavibacterium sp.]
MKKFKYNFIIVLLPALILAAAFSFNKYSKKPASVSKFEDFTLYDYEGAKHSLSDYKDSTAIVIFFIATRCPVSNAYNDRMESLYKKYSKKGIAFIGINPNKQEDVEEVKEHAKENNLSFTILKDHKNIIADKFDASVTPEAYVLNGNFELLYHGRIDDSRRESDVSTNDLSNALNEILSGKEVSDPETKAFGCSIKRI